MTRRSLPTLLLVLVLTLGLYIPVWLVLTAEEVQRRGGEVPSPWLLLVPIANLYWLWKLGSALRTTDAVRLPPAASFALLIVPIAGVATMQAFVNRSVPA